MRDRLDRFFSGRGPNTPSTAPLVVPLVRPDDGNVTRDVLDLTGAEGYLIGRAIRDHGIAGYEPEVLAMFCALVERHVAAGRSEPAWFLDIGANIGFFSLMLSSLFPGRVRATAFEPMPDLAAFVRAASRRNELAVDVREVALSNRIGRASFYVSRKSDTSNSLNEAFRPHKDVIDVEVGTLDGLYPAAIPGGCVMKIDTESTEPDVLDGARGFIERNRPSIVCEVLAGRTEDRLAVQIAELGYVPIHITDAPDWSGHGPIAGDTTYRYRDWLFVPEPPDPVMQERFAAWYGAFTREPAPSTR
jgi:FkbM family methyltransferase